MNYQVHTFGCKVNTYDTGLIQKNLSQHKISSLEPKLDPRIHVLNTCAVTAEATKEAVRLIRKLKIKDPFCTIVVTGCAAQVDTGAFADLPGADLVVANSHKGLLPQIIEQYFKGEVKEKVFKSNIFRKDDLEMGGGEERSHTRSFLKIQDGCNSFCTYCIIPFARGKSRSIPVHDLIIRINELYEQGVREVVLTGVHIGDYEDRVGDKKLKLEDLVERILMGTRIPRFRLSSLEPIEVTDRLLDLYQDSRMCPHFHMSIQSANTEVLEGMKRNYNQAQVIESLVKISERVSGAFVGMDVIVGFPSESEAQFEDTYAVLAETPWTRLHVFPYSERPGTKAALMTGAIHGSERARRGQKLRELSLHRYQSQALQQIGKIKDVLVLKATAKGLTQGLSRDYWPVEISGVNELASLAGQEIKLEIKNYFQNPQKLEGHLQATPLGQGKVLTHDAN